MLFSNFISNKINKYCAHTVGNDGYFLQLMMVIVLPIVIITYILYHLGMAANYYTYFYPRILCILILFSLYVYYVLIERQLDKIYCT